VELDQPIASALLAGLIRDSHGFSTETTTARTLAAAAAAVEAGAPIEPIYRSTLIALPLPTMALWGRLLNAMQVDAGGRIVHATLTEEMLAATGTSQHDADGFVEFLARGSGVAIGLLFRQLAEGTRVSLRVAPGIDAASIAADFGGGGHVRRAGCFLPMPSDQAAAPVIEACRRRLP
jgi:phosphoesterase RecJ-like protein